MSLATASLVSSASQPLRMRMRADLIIEPQSWHGKEYWVVKDPLSLKYYRFETEEITLLRLIDGEASADDIVQQYAAKFAPNRITHAELHQFVSSLHRNALLISDAAGQGVQLEERRRETETKTRWGAITNVLSHRLPGFDPDRFLGWLIQWVGWFFSPVAILFFLALGIAALLMVATEFETFYAKLPTFQQFFSTGNWFYLACTLACVKVLHEFGHGLACKKAGGECHEMGVMFLVFTPCLYCNVSDSWMLPSKWKRAGIGAAGMYVEFVLATFATFIWWYSAPGVVHYLALNVMFVCSVSTLMFNANPLMRYDGYYILSDLLEIPNLRQKSEAILRSKMNLWLMGIPERHDPFLPQRNQWAFAFFTVAAAAYRWLISVSIFWFLYQVLEPYGLQIIGQALAMLTLWGLVGMPLWQTIQFFQIPGRINQVKKLRAAISLTVLAAVIAGVLTIPLPHYVYAPVVVEPLQVESVMVETAGSIRTVHAKPGEVAAAGDLLVTLENPTLSLEIGKLHGRIAELDRRIENLEFRVVNDDFAAKQMRALAKTRAALVEQLRHRENDLQRLQIRTPVGGMIAPPVARKANFEEGGPLPQWEGTPLDRSNVGASLTADTVVCRIAQPGKFAATLAIDQGDMEFISGDHPVEIVLEQSPYEEFASVIEQVSPIEMKTIPISLSNKGGGPLPTTTDPSGAERPVSAFYTATAPLADETNSLIIGGRGQARILVGSRTIGQRLWRSFCQTFNFEM